MKESIIHQKSFAFALEIIKLYRSLVEQKEYVLSKQLLRSGTSIGANIHEAISAQSRADFLSKISIAAKEARETHYWLTLLQESQLTPVEARPWIQQCDELLRILISIVKTTEESLKKTGLKTISASPEIQTQNSEFRIQNS